MSRERVRLAGTPRAVNLIELEGRPAPQVILERVHELGRARGAEEHSRATRDSAVQALHAAAERLDSFREQARTDLARTSVELAVAIAERLLVTEIARDNIDIEKIVREALQAASSERGPRVVHLNPADLEALEGVQFRAGTEVRADVGVARGDVQVETSLGLLVRELESALESIGERLLEELP